jgi:hypothetical protein
MNAPPAEAEAHARVSRRENRLYVGNLAYDCTYSDLSKFMSGGASSRVDVSVGADVGVNWNWARVGAWRSELEGLVELGLGSGLGWGWDSGKEDSCSEDSVQVLELKCRLIRVAVADALGMVGRGSRLTFPRREPATQAWLAPG